MFLVSLKSLKGKLVLLFCVVVAAVVLCVIFSSENKAPGDEEICSEQVNAQLNFSAATEEQRKSFINQLGFSAADSPETITDIVIPDDFSGVYAEYNELQKECGLDLSRYKGVTAKKFTYILTDYPGYEGRDCVRITMLVYKDKIIGGDICSTELDGFMHSFVEK